MQRRKLDDSFLEDDLLSVYGANQNAITNAAPKVAKRMKEMVTE